MARKKYLLVDDEPDIVTVVIWILVGVGVVTALIMAAAFALPLIAVGVALWGVLWGLYRTLPYFPAVVARRDMAKLRAQYRAVEYLSKLVEVPGAESLANLVIQSVENDLDEGKNVPTFMVAPIVSGTKEVLAMSGLEDMPPFDRKLLWINKEARYEFREKLDALQQIYKGGDESVDVVFWYLCNCVGHVCERLPSGDDFGEEPNDYDFTVEILDVLSDLKGLTEVVSFLPFGEDEAPSLSAMQNQSLQRFAAISGKRIDDLLINPQKIPHPRDAKGTPKEVFLRYLSSWPLLPMLKGRVAYRIPPETRFEHMHVLGGTGHGKTQLLQRFVREDLTEIYFAHRHREAGSDDRPPLQSLVVIDGQGDLIKAIKKRKFCSPNDVLRDKVILIDPTDITHPLALNMFDVNQDDLAELRPADREMIFNGTIELYVYLFGALLKAEMTQKQDVLFRYIARLMLAIPNATLEILRDVIENGEDYQPVIDTLDFTAQEFFRTQFFSKEYDDTKAQLARRLWGVISNTALANMFNSPVNKINLFEELQRGVVVLIDTSKDFLQTDNSQIFGRFWIAMLAQAALRRSALYPRERVDTHVYIDEAHEYCADDPKIEEILNQARKYRIGITLAHQNRAQLSQSVRATVASSTSIKMVGGVSAEDASKVASDLRTDAETVMAAKKHSGGAEFVTFVRNHTDAALTLNVGFGTLERMDEMDYSEQEELRGRVRDRYCRSEHEDFQQTVKKKKNLNEGGFELGDHEDI